MARANFQRNGFQFYSPKGGGGLPQPMPKAVADNYGTALYVGDPVALVSDGTIARAAAGSGTAIYGVISAILQFKNADGVLVRNGKYIPANTRWTAHEDRTMVQVILASSSFFAVDADDGSTITTLAGAMDVEGENCDHIFATADAGLGLSGALLDISTNNTTDSLQWRIQAKLAQVGNDFTVTHGRYIVSCNVVQDGNVASSATGI